MRPDGRWGRMSTLTRHSKSKGKSVKELQYERGTLIGFEVGEYSDFRFTGMLVSLTDLDIPALARKYRNKINPKQKPHNDEVSGFLAWLVAGGYAAPVDYSTIHLGAYDEFYAEVIGGRGK